MKQQNIPVIAQEGWPENIWMYKPVPKGDKSTPTNYHEHYWIRKVPSASRWNYLQKKWKIWDDQISDELIKLDREYRKAHKPSITPRQRRVIMQKIKHKTTTTHMVLKKQPTGESNDK